MNCKEYALDDVMAIVAIPVADIPSSDVSSPVNQLTPTIPEEYFDPVLTHAITIGMQAATTGGILIPITRKSGKVKDETSDNTYGRLHTVTARCGIDVRGGELWEPLSASDTVARKLALERRPHHLLLYFRDGQRAFASATKDTYLCTINGDEGSVSIDIRIQNLMGLQMIV